MEPVLIEDQVIRYVTIDGASVAWSAVGSGPPLVIGGWWSSHLELDWADAAFRSFVSQLAAHRTVIRYDRPGTGLSDRSVPPATSLNAELRTLSALLDHIDPGPVALLGASSGCLVAVAYTASRPDRVSQLILYGSYAAGADIAAPAARDAMLAIVNSHWGIGSRVLSDIFMPTATALERRRFADFQRRSATREVAHASLRAVYSFDGTALLGRIAVPTLVLHRRDDRAIPFALGRDIAQRIPGARFVALQGLDHFPWRGDTASVASAVLAFLGVTVPAQSVSEQPATEPSSLSPREREVLALVARGLTDQEIATQLVLSVHTVHRHVANVRTRLGVPSRAAAAAWATEKGVI